MIDLVSRYFMIINYCNLFINCCFEIPHVCMCIHSFDITLSGGCHPYIRRTTSTRLTTLSDISPIFKDYLYTSFLHKLGIMVN